MFSFFFRIFWYNIIDNIIGNWVRKDAKDKKYKAVGTKECIYLDIIMNNGYYINNKYKYNQFLSKEFKKKCLIVPRIIKVNES